MPQPKPVQSIDEQTIQRIAEIARLRLTPEEISSLHKDSNEILGYFAKINELQEKGSELYYMRPADNPMREDKVVDSKSGPEIRSQFAHTTKEGLMRAPKNL